MNKYYNYPNKELWGSETSDTADFRSGVVSLAKEKKWTGDNYDLVKMMHTATGKAMMEAAVLEKNFTDINDPGLEEFWNGYGLDYKVHEKNGENWLSFVPKGALEQTEKLPVLMIFRPACVFAQSFYYHMNMIAAQGEMIILCFSTEDKDENELYLDIFNEACALYPIDRTRVYLTGHSHYGEFALEFMRRHHEMIAAVVQQGDVPGMIPRFVTDEQLEQMHSIDMPLIDVAGMAEMNSLFPVNTDSPCLATISQRYKETFPQYRDERITTWQKRLYASRCEVLSTEEIIAASNGTRAEQMLGFPADHSETLLVDGCEYYIGDIKNVDGNTHLRVVAVENLSHTTTEFMHKLSWSFVRRFARDLETGAVIELYK